MHVNNRSAGVHSAGLLSLSHTLIILYVWTTREFVVYFVPCVIPRFPYKGMTLVAIYGDTFSWAVRTSYVASRDCTDQPAKLVGNDVQSRHLIRRDPIEESPMNKYAATACSCRTGCPTATCGGETAEEEQKEKESQQGRIKAELAKLPRSGLRRLARWHGLHPVCPRPSEWPDGSCSVGLSCAVPPLSNPMYRDLHERVRRMSLCRSVSLAYDRK